MIDLTGKVALVTGASGGIGRAIAKDFHLAGCHVVLSGTNEDRLQETADILKDNYTIKKCDLKDHNSCAKLIDEIEQLDILVCNAGITKDMLSIKMSLESFEEVIDVNLKSSFVLNQAAIKKMMRARKGRIINISSVVGVMGNPGQANYCASKAGLIGMSKSLAAEVATRGITINCVAPGFVKSNMTDVLSESQKETVEARIPMKRIGDASEISSAVTFLASDLASYITGQTIHVNGGMLMV